MADLSRVLGRLFAAALYRPAWQRYIVALLLPLLAAAITWKMFGLDSPYFPPFGLAIVLVATYGGTRAGLVALGLSLAINVVLLPPTFTLAISEPNNVLKLVFFGVVGSVFALVIGASGRLQQKLDLERQRLRVTLSSIGDAVVATDNNSRVTFMNRVAEEATGWRVEDGLGCSIEEVFNIRNEETGKPAANPVEKVLATGKIVGLANHTVLVRRDGSEIPIDDSAAPIIDAGEIVGVILVFRDVTEAKATQMAIMRAEKLAGVGRLAATIAHEINNPLEAVTNLLYLIEGADDLSTARDFAKTAQSELARASHVSKQVLSFARQPVERTSTLVGPTVRNVIALYENRLNAKNISINTDIPDGISIWSSASELAQLVSNLLVNAIDAEKPGGRISLRAYPLSSKNAVRICLSDTGAGIDRESRQKLFQPFFTTKKEVGTGLGLWVCRGIVDSHGGSLRLRSKIGAGTVFQVTFPASKAEAAVAGNQPSATTKQTSS